MRAGTRVDGEQETMSCVTRLLDTFHELVAGAIQGVSMSAGIATFGPEGDDAVA